MTAETLTVNITSPCPSCTTPVLWTGTYSDGGSTSYRIAEHSCLVAVVVSDLHDTDVKEER